jgi:hypothetical protein
MICHLRECGCRHQASASVEIELHSSQLTSTLFFQNNILVTGIFSLSALSPLVVIKEPPLYFRRGKS